MAPASACLERQHRVTGAKQQTPAQLTGSDLARMFLGDDLQRMIGAADRPLIVAAPSEAAALLEQLDESSLTRRRLRGDVHALEHGAVDAQAVERLRKVGITVTVARRADAALDVAPGLRALAARWTERAAEEEAA